MSYNLTREDIEENANAVVSALAEQMAKDGLITSREVIENRYVVVLHKKGTLSKFLDKLFNRPDEDATVFRVLQTGESIK